MSPVVPILAALAAAGGAAAGVWYWLREKEVAPAPSPAPGPAPGPSPGPAPAPTPDDSTYCAAAGKRFDVDRWASPVHIMAGMIGLGYPVGLPLTSASAKAQIKALQRALWEQKIGPYAKAKESWIHGRVGPCLLISMSEAERRGINVFALEGLEMDE